MTTTSIMLDEYFLIDDGDARTDAISIEVTVDYINANRWQITDVHALLWTGARPHTLKKVKPTPGTYADMVFKIMTNESWCEYISETIASEIAQARQPSRHVELLMG